MILAKASLSSDCSFTLLTAVVNYNHTVIQIVNYNCKTFILQANGRRTFTLAFFYRFVIGKNLSNKCCFWQVL
jgi:hypothetical protein